MYVARTPPLSGRKRAENKNVENVRNRQHEDFCHRIHVPEPRRFRGSPPSTLAVSRFWRRESSPRGVMGGLTKRFLQIAKHPSMVLQKSGATTASGCSMIDFRFNFCHHHHSQLPPRPASTTHIVFVHVVQCARVSNARTGFKQDTEAPGHRTPENRCPAFSGQHLQ